MVKESIEKKLEEAASKGDITTLRELLQQDPILIHQLSFPYSRNLLHIATMSEQEAIVEEITRRYPQLARNPDSQKSSPLHMAAARGSLGIAARLITVALEMCWWRDDQGMNPVHVAAVKGHVEMVKELLRVDSFPAMERVRRGQTVLHLCVKHRQIEALKVLADKLGDLVCAKDDDGDTLLHLAVRSNQLEKMGRASKWFRGLLSFKKPDPTAAPSQNPPSKKKWSFPKGKHCRRSHHHAVVPGGYVDDDETSRQVIALATATAAVAEAAVAAAHAAAAVAQLTSGGGFDRATAAHGAQNGVAYSCPEERAAVVIQSHFRAYLSRRALRALRALVKLQAVVRGHILRKRNVDKLRQLQALVRAQARARVGRLLIEESTKPSHFNHTEKADHAMLAGVKMQRRKGEKAPWDQSDKVVQVDTGRPNTNPVGRTVIHSSQPSHSSDHTTWSSTSLRSLTLGLDANGTGAPRGRCPRLPRAP
ncbi:ankyrin repeat-containing protein NPR4-like isoform X1 [Salvia hispanica]|uniref:ankyrin repeat-containing protein NPR4-like isoform X1 n=1 Tax=Salvia hispanica TaxID=49212 RepID=UPI00200987CE|nr:ankyrin repeat-containing protein NPR4-like isoform X1 [Salvia hispanica]